MGAFWIFGGSYRTRHKALFLMGRKVKNESWKVVVFTMPEEWCG